MDELMRRLRGVGEAARRVGEQMARELAAVGRGLSDGVERAQARRVRSESGVWVTGQVARAGDRLGHRVLECPERHVVITSSPGLVSASCWCGRSMIERPGSKP